MSFKYYDVLSNLIVGIIIFYVIWKIFLSDLLISDWVIIPAGYVVGYFLNAISSIMEPVLFRTICGKPSNKLLTPIPGKKWTGINQVKFYFAEQAIDYLRKDTGDVEATTDKMFCFAMQMVNSNKECRVPDFNGKYALSRVIFATVLVAVVVVEIFFYGLWYSWLLSFLVLTLSWNRFRVYAYYYAREVLNEYLKMKKNK